MTVSPETAQALREAMERLLTGTAQRTDGTLTWATAEVALAPLAAGDYALRLKTERAGKSNEVVTGFRIVP